MKLNEIIRGRRSVRAYEDRPVPEEVIKELIDLGIQAPTSSRMQPWSFVVVEDKELMREWSDRTKELLLGQMEVNNYLKPYQAMMENAKYNIFHQAPCLLLIYGDTASPKFAVDCSLAAQNIMLAAFNKGLGSCWIGFAVHIGDAPEMKHRLGVPDNYRLVAPLVLGYPRGQWPHIARKEPVIFSWKK